MRLLACCNGSVLFLRNFGYIAYHSDVDSCKCHVFRLKSPAQNFVGAVLSHVRNDHNLPTQGWTETVKGELICGSHDLVKVT